MRIYLWEDVRFALYNLSRDARTGSSIPGLVFNILASDDPSTPSSNLHLPMPGVGADALALVTMENATVAAAKIFTTVSSES